MFIGHFAVALGAKKAAPKVSLGTLIMAAQFVDLLWPIFLLIGVEHVRISPGDTAYTPLDFYDYPVSHSLLTGIGWAIIFGLVYYACTPFCQKCLDCCGLCNKSLVSRPRCASAGFADCAGHENVRRVGFVEFCPRDNHR